MFRQTTSILYITTTLISFAFINSRIQDSDKIMNIKMSTLKLYRPHGDTGSTMERGFPSARKPGGQRKHPTSKFGDTL
jgi:hypothetical protein